MSFDAAYMKVNRQVAEAVARRQSRNGHDPERKTRPAVDPLVKSVRESTDRVTSAVTRLFKSLDEAVG